MKQNTIIITALAVLLVPSPVSASDQCTPGNRCTPQSSLTCDQDIPISPNISPYPSTQPTTRAITASHTVTNPTPTISAAKRPTNNIPLESEPTPTITIDPTPTSPPPSPTNKPIQQAESPSPTITSPDPGGLDANLLFDLVNQHRQSLELPSLQKDERLCQIAAARQPELNNEIFGDGYVHQGFDQQSLEWWVTENMVHQPSEQAALNWWLSSSLHRTAIQSTSHTHTCTACSGNTCIQLFTSWEPK